MDIIFNNKQFLKQVNKRLKNTIRHLAKFVFALRQII